MTCCTATGVTGGACEQNASKEIFLTKIMGKEAGCLATINTDSLGKEVPVAQIDGELHEFFASDTGISRASLINLAIYSETVDRIDQNTRLIQELTREHACRSLLIVSQPGGDRKVRSWVQAHCNIGSEGEKAVCSEQISFLLCGGSADLVRNVVFAHLDADLPLIFWWQGELSEIFENRLYSRIDRLIVDSRDWADPATQFLRLVDAAQENGSGYVVHDMAFTQSNQLREAVAVCFDNPVAQAEVKALSKAEIHFVAGHRMAAVWLVAWLANRLKLALSPDRSSGDCFVFEHSSGRNGAFQICLNESELPKDGDDQSPPISGLTLHVGKNGGHFDIVRSDDGQGNGFWRLDRVLPEQPANHKLRPARRFGTAHLLSEILMRAGKNRMMGELLPQIRALLTI